MDGIEVPGVEAEGQYDGGGSKGGGVTIKVRVGSHDCWVGFRAATRLGRYYYRCAHLRGNRKKYNSHSCCAWNGIMLSFLCVWSTT